MKRLSIALLVTILTGCGGMRMQDASSGSGASGTSSGMSQFDRARAFPGMDPTFEPYYGE
ncbi:MAG TPA: hypothetical protein VGE12_21805 [Noviherbaspirillum sp.]